jgi:hypothetical protein
MRKMVLRLSSVGLVALSTATVLSLGLFSGCRDTGPRCVQVRGQVTYKGKPLTAGSICFSRIGQAVGGGLNRPASGELQSDGSYVMQTFGKDDGVLPGEYAVTIAAVDTTRPASTRGPDGKPLPPGVSGQSASLIPEKYGVPEMSGLKVTVPADASGPLQCDFDLHD